jgi:tetratricopeptide (TPR) repeat protein
MSGQQLSIPPLALKLAAPALAFLAALMAFALIGRSEPAPVVTDAAGEFDARAGADSQQRIADLQAALAASPESAELNVALGDAYHLRSRETADPAFYARAERAYDAALSSDPGNPAALSGAATIALARHDFGTGLGLAERAHRAAPQLLRTYPALIDAQIELGRYAAAAQDLQRFVGLKPSLAAYARVSYFRELHGDLDGAVRAMRLAVAGGGGGESLAYVQALLGGLELDRGRIGAAELAFRRALAADPGHPAALAGLARVEAARGRFGAAIARLRGVVERLPLPEYAIALAETELAAGRRAAAQRDLGLVGVERRLYESAGVDVGVELALFEADHGNPAQAVRLGRHAWRNAPSVRSADAYAWALASAGRDRRAAAMSAEAMRLGSRDPSFLYHAGVIAAAAGEAGRAHALLERLVDQSPKFHPLYGPRARQALEALG